MRRVSRVGTADGRKPSRVSPRRGESFTGSLYREDFSKSPEVSPRREDSRRKGREISSCANPGESSSAGCTGAFIFFSSSRNVLLRAPQERLRAGTKPVDLGKNLTPGRPGLNSIGSRRECQGAIDREIPRDHLDTWSPIVIAHAATASARRSCREAMLALNPSSQHHRSRPAVTNRGVRSNRSRNVMRRSGGRGERGRRGGGRGEG